MQTEPTEELITPSVLGTQPPMWDSVNAVSLLSSDSEKGDGSDTEPEADTETE